MITLPQTGHSPRPTRTTLAELIVEQALRTPDAVAVCQWTHTMTYAGLMEAAGTLAAVLRAGGVGPETRVGVCVDRTLEMPVAALAVLLAGGAYVPLDSAHPVRRLGAILDDAGIEVVVADAAGRELLADTGRQMVAPAGHDHAPAPDRGYLLPDNAAYVIYTSGSTGRPKGVVVSHRAVLAFGDAVAATRPTGPGCRSAGFAALSFDTSLFDTIMPLATGATVALAGADDRADPVRLQRFLVEHRVRRALLPASVLPLLDPGALPELTEVFTAGDTTGPEQVARWSRAGRGLHNWYGPTETIVVNTGAELFGEWTRPLPIGRPLPGVRVHVLDERLRPCAPGEPGELCFGGDQLARGYLAMPGHTADRFVPDPFGDRPGARLYRSGDRGAWRPDGMLAFLGRLDRQVQIHGHRVEIGELETVLSGHPRVRQAVVDVATGPAGPRLVAYLSPADAPDLAELREYCARYLPAAMLPSQVLRRATLPLTVSAKFDLAALRADTPAEAAPTVPGGQATVATVWAEVFGGPVPAPDTDFAAAGGNSLLAMRLVSALRVRLGRQVELADVRAGRTVAGLAERVRSAAPIAEDPVPSGSPAALSPMQRRLWFVEQLTPGVPAHNIALAQRIRGALAEPALRSALRSVAERQEALRWRVPARHGSPTVEIDPPGDVPLPVSDLTGMSPAERETALGELLHEEANTPFDLAMGPLWRVRLIRLAADEHVLAITVHHMVFDGWSAEVLYRDLARAYLDATTAHPQRTDPLPAGYGDYVAWSAARRKSRGPADLDWWSTRLADVPQVLDLPRDRPRPAVQTFLGAMAVARIEPDCAERVRAIAATAGATPFVVLLAAFGHLLGRLTGQSDLIVGIPLADRGHVAFEPLVGCCLHLLPLRMSVSGDQDFATQVHASRDELAGALEHRDLSLERLVDTLSGPRDLSRNPLVQVLFNMYDFAGTRLELTGTTADPLAAGLSGSLYDLTLYVSEDDGGFALRAVYNRDLFDADRVEALLAGYRALLARLVAAPGLPTGAASLRTPTDRLPDPQLALPERAGADVLTRFARQAAAHPDRVAARGAGGSLSYAESAELCARTTTAVRAAGVPDGAAVAVLAARDVRLPAILLGILASGARWVVLDPDAPAAVLAAQLDATPVGALIRLDRAARPELPEPAAPELDLAEPGNGTVVAEPVPAVERGYYSLTSGSTGLPRPVLTTDRPLAHFLDWYPRTFWLGETDRFALLAGLAHDPLLRDAFTPLVLGATLCVPEPGLLREPRGLLTWLAAEQITVLHLTPQSARLLAAAADSAAATIDAGLGAVRLVLLAGDHLTDADLAPLRRLAPNARLVNGYGATETPQVQAYHEITGPPPVAVGGLAVPVGRGIDGVQLLVLNRHDGQAGVGELGEVLIRGGQLATGYTDAAATALRFGVDGPAAGRWYRTGDLGRYRPDGAVILAGRSDDQVKIHGFRVELGAVEAALTTHPDIRAACVLAVTEGAERRLRGYAVPRRAGVRTWEVTEHLRARLPAYAVPADLVLLTAIPLTRNGKVDHAALRATARTTARERTDELTGRTQLVIAGVWSEVLNLPRAGASDNFFEVGGHSLAIVVVSDRLSGLLGRPVPVVDLFRHPTIRALASHLDGAGPDSQVERARQRAAGRRNRARRRTTAIETRTRSGVE